MKQASPDGFVLEHRFAIKSIPTVAWEVLVHPERDWPDDHTWSGHAANMRLTPVAGGCFCEQWAEGSAEHGRVIMAVPGKLLRFRGALDPFQDMAVTGVMSVAVDPVVRQQFAGFAALAFQPQE